MSWGFLSKQGLQEMIEELVNRTTLSSGVRRSGRALPRLAEAHSAGAARMGTEIPDNPSAAGPQMLFEPPCPPLPPAPI
jgi:hypothetical protein